jgi:hypothetical protein
VVDAQSVDGGIVNSILCVDATGCGIPVIEMIRDVLKRQPTNCIGLVCVTISGGYEPP